MSREASEGESALLSSGFPIYQRGGALVRPILEEVNATHGRRSTVAQLGRIELPYMRDLLCRSGTWRKFDCRRNAEVPIDPPTEVARVILHRQGEWRFPQVVGVFTTPTMRPDGSLLTSPGYGQPCPVFAAGRTEEETEKRLGPALIAGQPLISIDNVNGDLAGDTLCQAIERPVVKIRVLGKSELVQIEARATLFATGNNIRILGDLARRVLRCRLDSKREQPEYRQFRRRPVAAVLADRGRYVAAILTLVRAYVTAGKPHRVVPLASFEGWSDLVRSGLIWLGNADPVEITRSTRDDDPNRAGAAALFRAWRDAIGLEERKTASEIIQIAGTKIKVLEKSPDAREVDEWQYAALRESLLGVADRHGVIDAREFGKWLSRHRDRIIDGLRLESMTDRHGHAARWWLVAIR